MQFEFLKSEEGKTIEGLLLLKPEIYKDPRGFFMESWNAKEFNKVVKKDVLFIQDNHSNSVKGVLRGLHYQSNPFSQGKLIRCIKGKIFDVAVDIRESSNTFGQWVGVILDSINNYQLWIPEGFAHGFLTLSKNADVAYKTNQYWMKKYEASIRWNDPNIAIKWPLENLKPLLSEKDSKAPLFYSIDKDSLFR